MRIDQIELSGSLSISASLATNPLIVNKDYLFVSNTGNVGIGTKTPTSKLVVTGSISARDSINANTVSIGSSASRPSTIDINKMCLWFDNVNLRPMITYCSYGVGSWSAGGAMITARRELGGAGTQNEGLAVGGFTNVNVTCTEEYNGTSWSAGGSLILARRSHGGGGIQGAGVISGGFTSANVSNTEEYDKPLQIFDCCL
jgi:hypothetical protein